MTTSRRGFDIKRKGFAPLIPIVILAVVAIAAASLFIIATPDTPGSPQFSLRRGLVANGDVGCKNVFCADYENICCGSDLSATISNYNIEGLTGFEGCPSDASFCEYMINPGDQFVMGSNNCHAWQDTILWWVTRFSCSDDVFRQGSGDYVRVSPGTTFHACKDGYTCNTGSQPNIGIGFSGEFDLNLKVYRNRLNWCGGSTCAVDAAGHFTGIPVQGASQCTFVTNADIYDKNGALKKDAVGGADFQYTVDPGYCYLSQASRHICGSTCEECSADNECKAGHTGKYTYNNVEYGAECKTGQIELYGCKAYGTLPTLVDGAVTLFPSQKGMTYNAGNKCDVVKTITAQCCPWSDSCGANAFCDKTTLTCKSSGNVECSNNWECGTATSCTYDDNDKPVIAGKICQASKCVKNIEKHVGCCTDNDCPTGVGGVEWYCGADYSCKQGVNMKEQCPYQCCVGSSDYREKLCVDGTCCGGACKASCDKPAPTQTECSFQCNAEKPIWDVMGITTIGCNFGCWLNENLMNIAIGIFAGIFICLALHKAKTPGWVLAIAFVAVVAFSILSIGLAALLLIVGFVALAILLIVR